jgi:nucleotide-binding universal stress UspA family protein
MEEQRAMGEERRAGSSTGRRILVISNETVTGTVLHDAIRFRARNLGGEVLVVAPALNSRLRYWMSDVDAARRAAEERLEVSLKRLNAAGIRATGQIGDGDPLQAIADALSVFPADEIIIATHPEARSHWLAHDLVGRARARFAQPITHIVVDLADHSEYVAGDGVARAVRPGPAPTPTLTAS